MIKEINNSHFAESMIYISDQISAAKRYLYELDRGRVFAMPPTSVAVAERLMSYCYVDPDSGRVSRRTSNQKPGVYINYEFVSDDQIRLCSKLLGPYRLLPSAGSETSGEVQIGLVVSEPYNDHEGWKWIVMKNNGDLSVLNARHRDAHEVLQAPSEAEIYSHWKEIDAAIQEKNLQEPIRLADEASRYTNWQQILDAVPPLFPPDKSQ